MGDRTSTEDIYLVIKARMNLGDYFEETRWVYVPPRVRLASASRLHICEICMHLGPHESSIYR